ncbi:uncharacterized protein LOC124258247 [Haliotis rubra]|uniref:uncharacterized protein LOC124258247 n=1 Tax=Haliotis rubra TaxID=36100 RepID=UPI001EE5B82D|nr:uncharacterized protein LOC124258247 [Haliotis rubra]
MVIDQNETDLCVFRKEGYEQSHRLQGQIVIKQAAGIDVNCSEPVLVGPSTSSTPENKEQLWIIISCVTGGVALITIAICGLCICRRRRHTSQGIQGKADTGPVEDRDELVMVDNVLYSSVGFVNATQHKTRVNGVEETVN